MILFLLNVFLFSSAFGNTEEIIRANILKTRFYTPGRILSDHLCSDGFIAELIPRLSEGAASKVDLEPDQLNKYYLTLGYTSFLERERIADINFVPGLLSPDLAYLLGFYVNIDLINPIRLYPNLASLNARFKLLKDTARNIYNIPGSENIADIFFYHSSTKDSSSLTYLQQVARGGFPIATFLNGDHILAFHDLIHIAQLILTRKLMEGYSNFTQDFLVFLKFIHYETPSNILTDGMARLIDIELGNFVNSLIKGYNAAFNAAKKIENDTGSLFFNSLLEDGLKEYAISGKNQLESDFLKFKSLKNSGKSNVLGYSSAESPNSFIERINFLFDLVTYDFEHEEVYLKHALERFIKSDYGVAHNLKDKVYFANGFELYQQTLDHRIFMMSLVKHEGIQQLLAFPAY